MHLSLQWIYSFAYHANKSEDPLDEVVFRLNELEVKVDCHPIGGFRGKAGTLTIDHSQHKVFTEWSEDDLQTLAQLTQTILKIRENEGVKNTLIFGRQENDAFKLSFVPYPKCNWIEKINGLLHVIFGSPSLKKEQADEIAQFYQSEFKRDWQSDSPQTKVEQTKKDPFCNDEVIKKQRIVDLTFEGKNYHLLHDLCPKGSASTDPHLLVVPEKEEGHYDGSQVPVQQRFHLLKVIQQAMSIFQQEGFSTLLYEERIGSKLQGVQHIHSHAKGIAHFPQSFLEKIRTLAGLLWPSTLSSGELEKKIEHYQKFDWN